MSRTLEITAECAGDGPCIAESDIKEIMAHITRSAPILRAKIENRRTAIEAEFTAFIELLRSAMPELIERQIESRFEQSIMDSVSIKTKHECDSENCGCSQQFCLFDFGGIWADVEAGLYNSGLLQGDCELPEKPISEDIKAAIQMWLENL